MPLNAAASSRVKGKVTTVLTKFSASVSRFVTITLTATRVRSAMMNKYAKNCLLPSAEAAPEMKNAPEKQPASDGSLKEVTAP